MDSMKILWVIKQITTVYFLSIFSYIVFKTYKKRDKKRLEDYKYIPFDDHILK